MVTCSTETPYMVVTTSSSMPSIVRSTESMHYTGKEGREGRGGQRAMEVPGISASTHSENTHRPMKTRTQKNPDNTPQW